MTKWEEWYQTPEGAAYYEKYLNEIPFINDDTGIKNAYYNYVNSLYNTQDKISSYVKNNLLKILVLGAVLVVGYSFINKKLF